MEPATMTDAERVYLVACVFRMVRYAGWAFRAGAFGGVAPDIGRAVDESVADASTLEIDGDRALEILGVAARYAVEIVRQVECLGGVTPIPDVFTGAIEEAMRDR